MKKIKMKGAKFGVQYVMLESDERFLIVDNPRVSWDNVMRNIEKFDFTYVPKFGKFEIEEFVGYYMKEALLISKDITHLLFMELVCDDSPYNITNVSMSQLRERVLKCFDVVRKDGNITYLMFKWEVV